MSCSNLSSSESDSCDSKSYRIPASDNARLMELYPLLEQYPRNGQARLGLQNCFADLFVTMEYRSRFMQHKFLMDLKRQVEELKRLEDIRCADTCSEGSEDGSGDGYVYGNVENSEFK